MGIQWRVLKMNIWSPYVIQKVLNNEFFLQEKLSTGHGAEVTCNLLRYCLCRMMSSSFSLDKPWNISSWLQHIFPCSWEARGQGPWNDWIYGWCAIFFSLKMGVGAVSAFSRSGGTENELMAGFVIYNKQFMIFCCTYWWFSWGFILFDSFFTFEFV